MRLPVPQLCAACRLHIYIYIYIYINVWPDSNAVFDLFTFDVENEASMRRLEHTFKSNILNHGVKQHKPAGRSEIK